MIQSDCQLMLREGDLLLESILGKAEAVVGC